MRNSYQTEKTRHYTLLMREVIKELPPFCGAFFRGIESTTSVLTRYAYAVDLRGFFHFAVSDLPEFEGRSPLSLTPADLERIRPCHIEQYMESMSLYSKGERELTNREQAKARKLCALRSFFKYFFKREEISSNVASLVDTPKIHGKAIIRLEPNEVANLLDIAESGEGLSARQKEYQKNTRVRDVAILTLFLGTGIRISELVGIDLEDVDFDNDSFIVTRKGGSEDILSFGEEVRSALLDYAAEREKILPLEGSEQAFFLSLQRRRITARAVENLVKKYAVVASPLKKITPHKLRSTYGTMLYRETQDIYLVADVLGHKDVNTTKKHYAASSEDNKRIAAKKIKLRDD